MKKYFIGFIFLLVYHFCSAQDTVTVFSKKFVVKGEQTCHCNAYPHNGEDRIEPMIDCYAEVKNGVLTYSVVITVDSVNVGFDQYSLGLDYLELNKAKTDWEHYYFMSDPIKRLDIPVKKKAIMINYRNYNYRYNHDLPPLMEENFSMHFPTDKEAKAFLAKLKKASKEGK